jgi:hypothetical protein
VATTRGGRNAAEHLRALVGPIADAPEALAALRRAGDDDAVAGSHAPHVRSQLDVVDHEGLSDRLQDCSAHRHSR